VFIHTCTLSAETEVLSKRSVLSTLWVIFKLAFPTQVEKSGEGIIAGDTGHEDGGGLGETAVGQVRRWWLG
jgi:hypothetical protein